MITPSAAEPPLRDSSPLSCRAKFFTVRLYASMLIASSGQSQMRLGPNALYRRFALCPADEHPYIASAGLRIVSAAAFQCAWTVGLVLNQVCQKDFCSSRVGLQGSASSASSDRRSPWRQLSMLSSSADDPTSRVSPPTALHQGQTPLVRKPTQHTHNASRMEHAVRQVDAM